MDTPQFDDFDEFAHDYRKIHTRQTATIGVSSEYLSEFKVRLVRKEEEKKFNDALTLLDYGCGDGVAETFFEKHFPHVTLTGIDVSRQSVEAAQRKTYRAAKFYAFDGTSIPAESELFDMVFISMVLHHIEHSLHPQIFSELRRVLKPGGRIYIFEHNPLNPVTRYFINACEFDKDARLIWPGSLIKGLKNAGFMNPKTRFAFFFPRVGFLKKLEFIERYLSRVILGGQYYVKASK